MKQRTFSTLEAKVTMLELAKLKLEVFAQETDIENLELRLATLEAKLRALTRGNQRT
jgi:hypothetical protein